MGNTDILFLSSRRVVNFKSFNQRLIFNYFGDSLKLIYSSLRVFQSYLNVPVPDKPNQWKVFKPPYTENDL